MRVTRPFLTTVALVAAALAVPSGALAQASGTIAYVSSGAGGGIYTTTLAGGTPQLVVAGNQANAPEWSPNGSQLVYQWSDPTPINASIRVIPAAGGTDSQVANLGMDPVFSPNGLKLAYMSGGSVYVVPVGGGTPKRVASGTTQAPGWMLTTPVWTANGQRLLFVALKETRGQNTGQAQLRSVAATGGRVTQIPLKLPSGWSLGGGLSLSPSGTTLALAVVKPQTNPNAIWPAGIVFAPATGGTASGLVPGYADPSFSPDGTMVCATASAFGSPLSIGILSTSGTILQANAIAGWQCAWMP